MECGGNLYDAVSLAVKAALWDTRIPKIRSVILDGANVEMDVSEELSDCIHLDVSRAPIMVCIRAIITLIDKSGIIWLKQLHQLKEFCKLIFF